MQRRTWDVKTNAMIVIEGLKGKPVAELCNVHQPGSVLSMARAIAGACPKAFEVHEQSQREARLAREHTRLKTLVGELTLERNKRDARLGGSGTARFGSSSATRGGSTASRP